MLLGLALALLWASPATAHTVSYGYVAGTQPGQYTFYFGTYHTGFNYTEGQIQLTCGGGFSQTSSFTQLTISPNQNAPIRPAGLVQGVNYYYDAGYGGEAGSPLFASTPTHTNGTLTGPVQAYQSATFTNITYPGTCTFKYIPIAVPTQVWDPNGANVTLVGIGSGSFVLTEGITIAKTSLSTSYATVGQVLNYSYAVKNTGNMVLTAPLKVTDDKTTVSCPPFQPLAGTSPVVNGLATGATITCNASYQVTQADIDVGSVTNTASATSGTSTTPYTSPPASLKITAVQSPSMTVVKSTTATGFKAVGDKLVYSYLITNTGNTTLTSAIAITDNKIPAVTCAALPPGGLSPTAPNNTITCSGTYTVTQPDLDAGNVTNTANSVSGATKSPSVSVTVTGTQSPAMTVAKSTTATTYATLGASIPYTYVVTNTGNVTLKSVITVTDDQIASVTCPPLPSGGLAPGSTLTCNGSHTVTQTDLDTGTLTNNASAKSGTTTSPTVSVTLTGTKSPALTIAKSTTASTYATAGTSVLYTFTITNTGNVTQTGPFTVVDSKITAVSCPTSPTSIAPLSSITCTGSYKITQTDLDTGSVTNTATGFSSTTTSPPNTHTLTATQTNALSLSKTGAPATIAAPGVAVTYTYVVTNTGNTTILPASVMKITDDKLGTIACPAITSPGLAPGGTLTCTASYTSKQTDIDAGSIINSATATDGTATSPAASFKIVANQTSSLSVVKSTTATGFSKVGDVISYSYAVTNTGNTTQTAPLTISDNKIAAADIVCPNSSSFAPGTTLTCTGSYTVTQPDLDAGGVSNTAVAKTGGTVSTPPVTITVKATQSPALTLVKSSTTSAYTSVGQVIPYKYVVTNSGNVTLTTALAVNDNKIASISCPALPPTGLAPGASQTCTGSYTVTQPDLDGGSISNNASATSGGVTSPQTTLTIPASQTSSLAVVKTPGASAYATVGQTVSYSYAVTNTGNTTLKAAVTIADDKIVAPNVVSCPALPGGALAPKASITCTASYTVTQSDLDAGTITNHATATSGTTTSPPASVTVMATQSPALSVAKTASIGTFATAGVPITYTYSVTNTGNVTLKSAVAIADDKIPAASITCPSTLLAPGQSAACTASYTTTQADVDAGGITNTAIAKSGTTRSPPATLTVASARSPALTVTKSSDLTTYSSLPTTVHYTFTVLNSGNTTITTPVTITDSKIASVGCPALPGGVLAPNASIDCTANYAVTQADLDSGNIVNTATAKSGTTTSPAVTHTLTGAITPKLMVAKSADKSSYSVLGETITYSYVVTNTGNVSLTSPVTVSDNKIVAPASVSCPSTLLAPNASLTCTATYAVTQTDLDGGNLVNTASASSTTGTAPAVAVTSPTTSLTITATQQPKLTVTKTAASGTYDKVGQSVIYTFVATNAGNVTITTPITITDAKIPSASCPALPSGGLSPSAPNNTITCTGTYQITQADLDAGFVDNAATAQSGPTISTPPTPNHVPSCPATACIRQTPSLALVKTASPSTFAASGVTIVYTYAVTNTGNTTIPQATPITIADTKIASVTCPALPPAGLSPQATLNCQATYTTLQSDVDGGSITNLATASAGGTSSPQVSATVTATQTSSLSVAKSSAQTTYGAVGDTIAYSFAVTNTGNTTITTPVAISDNTIPAADITCPPLANGKLLPGGALTCSATYKITQPDLDAGSVVNTAIAKSGTTTSPPVTHTLTGTQTHSLTIAKSGAPSTFAKPGVVITYTYGVTNSGNTDLPPSTVIKITDSKLGAISCPAISSPGLAPGGTLTCTATYSTQQADVDAGSIVNTATATDGTTTSPPVTATVTATQTASMQVDKQSTATTFDHVGEVISYTFKVTNTGNTTQTAPVSISDSKIKSVSCPTPGPLAPGASLVCNATYTITQADIDAGTVVNLASATSGTTVSTPPTPHTLTGTQSPALTVAKSTATASYGAVGTVVTYDYLVTNTGNVTLMSTVTIGDNKIATVSCKPLPPGGLAPGGTVACTGKYTVKQSDIDSGSLTNTATASSGSITSAPVSVTINASQSGSLSIAKSTPATGYSALGTVIPYSYVVTNNGNTTLKTAVTVTDDKIKAVTCNALPPAGLAPGGSLTCSGTYTITQPDLDAGSVANTASAKSGGITSPPVTISLTGTQLPALSVVKSSTSATFTAAGQSIPYAYAVTNTGNVTLTASIAVTDTKIAAVVCPPLPAGPPAGLAPGATLTCNATYVTTQADVDAGSVTNAATAKSGTITSPQVSLTLSATQSPGLTVVKTSSATALVAAGQLVTYNYQVTNTGNTSLTSKITVADDKIAAVLCPVIPGGTLAPGGAITCTANYTVQQADIDSGGLTNAATATSGTVTSPKVSLTIKSTLTPALTLVKTADVTQFTAVDQDIHYTFKATNTGNVTLVQAIGIDDALLKEDVGCPPPNPSPGGLKPGESVICAATYTVTQADMDAGFITNTAFAISGTVQSPNASVTIQGVQKSDFTIVKSTTTPSAVNNGNGTFTATFAVAVTNTGNTTLNGMLLADDYQSALPAGAKVSGAATQTLVSSVRGTLATLNPKFTATPVDPALITSAGETLAPAEVLTATFTITFDPALNLPGTGFTNTAVGTATVPNGTPTGIKVSKSATAVVAFTANHPLIVTKTTPLTDIVRGQLVPYTITVTNNFDPALTNISITDVIPAGFAYKTGSATVSGARKEPAIAGSKLTWPGLTMAKGKPVKITLILIAGSGLGSGEFTNDAFASTQFGDPISAIAHATVRIIPDPTFDCTDIIGRVFDDTNRNGLPDDGERGIANVRVATVKGQLITTDAEGRFHIACADVADSDRGSNFILKLDERTLPTGYRVTSENPRVIRITRGKMAKINFGASIHRVVRLDIADGAFEPGTVRLNQRWYDSLDSVFAPLKRERSVLRLAYRRSPGEDAKLALERVRALQLFLLETWRRDGAHYELSIETEVYAGTTASR